MFGGNKNKLFREPASCLAIRKPWIDSLTDSRLALLALNIQHVFVTRILLGRFPTSRQQATHTHTHTHTQTVRRRSMKKFPVAVTITLNSQTNKVHARCAQI